MTPTTLKKAKDLSLLIERFEELLRLLSDHQAEAKGGAVPGMTPALCQASQLNVIQPQDLLPFIQGIQADAKQKLAETRKELADL